MFKKSLFNVIAVLAILSIALTACGGGTSDQSADTGEKVTSTGYVCPPAEYPIEATSTELNIFVWTEYIPVEMIECFELVYGITVNRDEYSSNEEMYAKVSAGGSNYDLVQPTDYIIPLMIRQGLLQELDMAQLPVMENFDASYLDSSFDPGNKYSLPYQAGTDALVVNTDAVENVPQSWADLWNEEYAGRMVFLDDSRAVIGLTLLTLGYDVNTTDPDELEEAKNKLAELVPNVKLFDSDSPKTALIAGDVDLGMTWTAEALLAQQENPAIQYIYPTEGAILWQDNWVMLKDAPHADAAYAWLNYTNQGNIFWMMLRDFPYTNPNTAALEYAEANEPDLYEAYMSSPITNTPAEEVAKGHRIEDVGEATPLYDSIWVEVKGN
ncbi:MAG TPA: spermidine/putrescine ABC transporter substrate-binding protein [Anaerolineales bacterium]|nr:ABC transporter permease [Anaerolineae bacterium]HRJ55861.1 spermidine/putrescine ABC transporter substrate-binding protein [Anaerolineales bacterium]HRK88620.1 spermidine/putrescine ABC transporter substrate-binding protein [Anaerolineales bacterium]